MACWHGWLDPELPARRKPAHLITATLMYASAQTPFAPTRTALIPVLAVLILTSLATRFGRSRKEHLGTAEAQHGRVASQVAANLGVAGIVALAPVQIWLIDNNLLPPAGLAPMRILIPAMAALAEAAADTVSSEVGQVLGGTPRMITTWRKVDPGTDGAITLAGTLAGFLAAGIVSAAGAFALTGGWEMFLLSWGGGIFGLFFDSLLGATAERRGRLNNDAVNFLSTASAAVFTLVVMAILPHPAIG